MKNLIILVLIGLITSAAFSQSLNTGSLPEILKEKQFLQKSSRSANQGVFMGKQHNHGYFPDMKQKKSSMSGKQKLDSVVSESFNEELSQWMMDSKEEYSYNINGKQVGYTYYHWNVETEGWVPDEKEEFSYDAGGNQILYFSYMWEEFSEEWLGLTKVEYVYEDGLVRYEHYFGWREESSDWESEGGFTYEYTDGLLASITLSGADLNYDGEINELDQMRIAYYYDPQGRLIREITYFYPDLETGWYGVTKSEYTYNPDGNLETEDSYWIDEESGEWILSYRTLNAYDSSGNLISESYLNWDYEINDWRVDEIWEYEFSQNNDLMSMKFSYWDYELGSFVGNFKNVYTHDGSYSYDDLILPLDFPREYFNHMITGYSQYEFNGEDWVMTMKGVIFYSEFSASGISEIPVQGINIFPNPASETVTFQGNFIPEKTLVEIFDFAGKKVKSEVLPTDGLLSVGDLNSGIYIYKISSGKSHQTGKVVIR